MYSSIYTGGAYQAASDAAGRLRRVAPRHTSAYVSIRTYAYIRRHKALQVVCVASHLDIRQHTSAYERMHISGVASHLDIRQHMSAFVSIRMLTNVERTANILLSLQVYIR
jgi:hypothetical protein